MKKLTQTRTGATGNCWQTCVAMLLDVDPELLPPQADYDWKVPKEGGGFEWGPSYQAALQFYLHKHHDLHYVEIHCPEETLSKIRVEHPGWHMMTGRTVRSDSLDGARHVVVGYYGEVWWDPHPSRAGLLEDIRWGFLIPFPKSYERTTWSHGSCECPTCRPDFRCLQPGDKKPEPQTT